LKTFTIETRKKEEIHPITQYIQDEITASKIQNGIAVVYVPHTTCSLIATENTDPALKYDFLKASDEFLKNYHFKHIGGNGAAHFKSSLFGNSLTLLIRDSKLVLGKWQGVFLVEFDGPRPERTIHLKIMEG
jgi:secondary thiamine-phosphate synthase enzyme